ncbi:MAG: hypothetical protein A2176_11470 [Spirochaetes bacterium RBG_13_51_14]|nr:MAG: hypothetical protein A2176_11470 [Spirochaetes bacterium RBG_13_51_14]
MSRRIFFSAGFTPGAHRGASHQYPENTLEAFRRAREILPGCLIETDVRQTGDGRIVVIHDELLNPTTNGTGPVRGVTLAQIQRLDAGFGVTFDGGGNYPFRGRGYRIPLLSEALDAFPDAKFSIDIKDRDLDAAARVISIIQEKRAAGRIIVGSFHERVIRFVRKRYHDAVTSFSKYDALRFLALRKCGCAGMIRWRGDALLVPEFIGGGTYEYEGRDTRGVRIITTGLIDEAHRRGIPILAWTINRPDNMRRLIEWGINGVITDHIELLKEVMIAMNIK